jgi:hypothetical protein
MTIDDAISQAEYNLVISAIRQTIRDALNGHGIEEMLALFYPLPQAALQILLDADPEETAARTAEMFLYLKRMDDETRRQVRHAITWRGSNIIQDVLNAIE